MTRKRTRKFGLIGYPITHSFSPGYFARKFEKEGIADAVYDLYPLQEIGEIDTLEGLSGLNVTLPYKEAVIPFLDQVNEEAGFVGAVNTILFQAGKKKGFNTDVYGFEHSLIPLLPEHRVIKSLVLGSGGAAKAVQYVLNKRGIMFKIVSRTRGDITYDDLTPKMIEDYQLIVNTTPLGMSPKVDTCPNIPYDEIGPQHILYDLVYNPEKTLFLKKGEFQGAQIKGGLEMLELQAEKAWEIWNTAKI